MPSICLQLRSSAAILVRFFLLLNQYWMLNEQDMHMLHAELLPITMLYETVMLRVSKHILLQASANVKHCTLDLIMNSLLLLLWIYNYYISLLIIIIIDLTIQNSIPSKALHNHYYILIFHTIWNFVILGCHAFLSKIKCYDKKIVT